MVNTEAPRLQASEVEVAPAVAGSTNLQTVLTTMRAVPVTGTTTTLGFYTATPVVQAAAITAPTGGTVIDIQARAAIVSLLNAIGAAAGGVGITA